jgi:hypothetical protein
MVLSDKDIEPIKKELAISFEEVKKLACKFIALH